MISAAVIEALKEIVPADKVLLQEPMKLHTTSGSVARQIAWSIWKTKSSSVRSRNTFGWWMFPIP